MHIGKGTRSDFLPPGKRDFVPFKPFLHVVCLLQGGGLFRGRAPLQVPDTSHTTTEKMHELLRKMLIELNTKIYLDMQRAAFVRKQNGLYVDPGDDPQSYYIMRTYCTDYVNDYNISIRIPWLVMFEEVVHRKSFDHYRRDTHEFFKLKALNARIMRRAQNLLAAPLGVGKKDKANEPWLSAPIASKIMGISLEDAVRFNLASNGTARKGAYKPVNKKPRVGYGDVRDFMQKSGTVSGEASYVVEKGLGSLPAPLTKQASWAFKTFESNMNAVVEFSVRNKLPPFRWFNVKGYHDVLHGKSEDRVTTLPHEICIDVKELIPQPEVEKVPSLKVLSFDIETQPSEKNGAITQFYEGYALMSKLLTIGATIHTTGTKEDAWYLSVHQLDEGFYVKHDVGIGPPKYEDLPRTLRITEIVPEFEYNVYRFMDEVEGRCVVFYGYGDEFALFHGFCDAILEHKPEVLTGWNINGYDLPQMAQISCRLTAQAIHACNTPELQELVASEGLSATWAKLISKVDSYLEDKLEDTQEESMNAFFKEVKKLFNVVCRKVSALWDINYMQIWSNVNYKRGKRLSGNYKERHPRKFNTYRYNMTGIWLFDMYDYVHAELKLRSYKLDFVAKEFLGSQKLDMPYSEIKTAYTAEGFAGRQKLARYCVVDCLLVNRLIECKKIQSLNKSIFTSLLTHCAPNDLKWKGSTHMLRGAIFDYLQSNDPTYVLAATAEYYTPEWHEDYESDGDEDESNANTTSTVRNPGYQGATVLEAKAGFYTDPISTLDFGSLYPSCMVELNLCMSAILHSEEEVMSQGLTLNDVNIRTIGEETKYFVKNSIFQGKIPELLILLKQERNKAKKKMKAFVETDPSYTYYDGLQNSIKVIMNSLYGMLGLRKGSIFDGGYVLAALTTQRGRELIDMVKEKCERDFWTAPGGTYGLSLENRPEDAIPLTAVYGDTDSVFLQMKFLTVHQTFEFSNKIEDYFSMVLAKPHVLEYEKAYLPLLLIGKKQYSGVKYADSPDKGKISTSGIAVVRRDQILCVQNVCSAVLEKLMQMMPIPEIEAFVAEERAAIEASARNAHVEGATNKYQLSTFLESGSLNSTKKLNEYGEIGTCAVEIVRRIAKWNPEEVPTGGARVEFLIIAPEKSKDAQKALRARTLDDVVKEKLPLDVGHYLEAFDSKISTLLAPVYIEKQAQQERANGSRTISSYFSSSLKGTRTSAAAVVPLTAKRKSDRDKARGKMVVEKMLRTPTAATGKNAILYQNKYDPKLKRFVKVLKE